MSVWYPVTNHVPGVIPTSAPTRLLGNAHLVKDYNEEILRFALFGTIGPRGTSLVRIQANDPSKRMICIWVQR